MKKFKRDLVVSASLHERISDSKVPYVFERNMHKSKVYNAPLLVIGLGGSGYDALSKAKEQLLKCFESNEKGEIKGVEFLQIDTDDRDMKRCSDSRQRHVLKMNEFKIFQNADIGAILRNREKNSDVLPREIEEWLDPKIPVAQIVHGAAGIRQAGRLLLHLNIIEIVDVITEKLEKIRQSVKLSKKPVNVVIYTGLGGGTGSGTFVDIAYIVRECIKKFSGQAFITGVLLMPDILAGDPEIDKITRENIKRNGFAALKELDHLMNLSETKDKFKQKYPGGFEVEETEEAIFDRCVLISSMAEGRLLLPNAKKHAYNVAAEMLVDMLSNSTLVSNGSNDVSRKDAALKDMDTRKPVNYVYTAVGGKSVYVDFDLILNLFIEKVMEKEIRLFDDRDVVKEDINKIWENKRLDDELEKLKEFKSGESGGLNNIYEQGKLTEEQIHEKPQDYRRYVIKIDKHAAEAFRQVKEQDFQLIVDSLVGSFKDLYSELQKEYMLDVYRLHVLEMKAKLIQKLDTLKDYDFPKDKERADKLQNEIRNRAEYLCTGKNENEDTQSQPDINTKFRNVIACVKGGKKALMLNNSFADLNKIAKKRITMECYNHAIEILQSEITNIFTSNEDSRLVNNGEKMKERHRELTQYWKQILGKKYNSAASGCAIATIEEGWRNTDALFGRDSVVPLMRDVDVNRFIAAIREMLEEDEMVVSTALEYFRSIMDPSMEQLWLEKTNVSVDNQTGKIMEKAFDYEKICLDKLLRLVKEITQPELKEMWKEVLRPIFEQTGVLFSKKGMKDGEVFERPSYGEILLPKGNSEMVEACRELTSQKIEESDIYNRISYMKYTQCHKLDDYVYIDELERVYNQSNSKCGLHLRENDKEKWEDLPSPVYRNKEADEQMQNRYCDAKVSVFYRKVFDVAVERKIIQLKNKIYYIIAGKLKDGSPEHDIEICTLSCNGTDKTAEEDYKAYCRDWFTRMFYYREKVAEACKMKMDIK